MEISLCMTVSRLMVIVISWVVSPQKVCLSLNLLLLVPVNKTLFRNWVFADVVNLKLGLVLVQYGWGPDKRWRQRHIEGTRYDGGNRDVFISQGIPRLSAKS